MNPEVFTFRLYVAGNAPNSLQAIANLTKLCDEYLPDRHEIEIVDICVDAGRALNEEIYLTPTLICVSPYPGHRIVGTLSSTEPILQILGLGPANRRTFPGLKERHAAPQVRRPSSFGSEPVDAANHVAISAVDATTLGWSLRDFEPDPDSDSLRAESSKTEDTGG